MGKRRLFAAAVLLLAVISVASADEVISIDINNYGNDMVFAGEAAVPGATIWVGYDGGWGIGIGSPRTSGLANVGQVKASKYAAQVWVGDTGDHGYVTGVGNGLLDDGFIAHAGSDPNLTFIGSDIFADVAGQNFAYGGTFDLYVYGNSAGDFYLTDANDVAFASGSVTGTVSGFVEGENYVVFENIGIANPASVRLVYTNELNGIQLVKKSRPKTIINHHNTADPNDYTIDAVAYSAAYDTNGRDDEIDYGVGTFYGPDVAGGQVYMLDLDEYMEYDIRITAENAGKYNFYVDLAGQYAGTLEIFLDGNLIGTVTGTDARVGPVEMMLFEGDHVLKWRSTGMHGSNIDSLALLYGGEIVLGTCQDVYKYGLAPAGDVTGDCRVNLDDLALVMAEWAANYNPYH